MHVRSFIEIRADLGKIPSLSTTIGGNLQVLVHKFLGALTPPWWLIRSMSRTRVNYDFSQISLIG